MQPKTKYLLLCILNAIVLVILLYLGQDKLMQAFASLDWTIGLLSILGFSILWMALLLIPAGILPGPFYKIALSWRRAILLVFGFCLSFGLYASYIKRLWAAQFDPDRISLCQKLEMRETNWINLSGKDIEFGEYQHLRKVGGFPEVPATATHIQFQYLKHDLLLNDYLFRLEYDLPLTEQVKEYSKKEKNVNWLQKVEKGSDSQHVHYEEVVI